MKSTNARWKGERNMTELQINARTAEGQPKYKKTAAALLQRCREFYQDPESEKAYQEWKEKRSGQHEEGEV